MYVCICNNITEEELSKVAKTSRNTNEALDKLGVGNGCGICVLDALKKVDPKFHSKESSKKKKSST